MRRLTVHVSYRVGRFGRVVETAFSNVRLEASAYEGTPRDPELVPAYSLKPFGIDGRYRELVKQAGVISTTYRRDPEGREGKERHETEPKP